MKLLFTITIVLIFMFTAEAQYKENHKYVLGGSISHISNLTFLSPKIGKVMKNGNVLGLSSSTVISRGETFFGLQGWYRISKELEVTQRPTFYRADITFGYYGLFDVVTAEFNPGFTIPITKRTYLDLSLGRLAISYGGDYDFRVTLQANSVGLGFVHGL